MSTQISYSSFKNQVNKFNNEEYIKNQIDIQLFDVYVEFYEMYKDIEAEELKKVPFNGIKAKRHNNYKNYKNIKINREKEEKNLWNIKAPEEEINKITILIKSYLNKISEETYKKIGNDFIEELLKIDHPNLFSIICNEIYSKCINDQKYRHLYIYICNKIWSNRQIHYNMVNIIQKDVNLYYWENKYEITQQYGPFSNEKDIKNNIFQKINFKKYFIDFVQNLFNTKDMSFENIEEDEFFLKKKKILVPIELISIMFNDNYISYDIINLVIINLLHINNFDKIEDIEIEMLYNLIKSIDYNNVNYLNDNKTIFQEYVNFIKSYKENSELTKRSLFFLDECIIIFDNCINKVKQTTFIKKDNSSQWMHKLDNLNDTTLDEFINIYKNSDKTTKKEMMTKIIDKHIYQKKHNETIFHFIKYTKDIDNFYSIIEKIVLNINDIILDEPNTPEKLIQLLKYTDFQKSKNERYYQILTNIDSESSSSETESESEIFSSKWY